MSSSPTVRLARADALTRALRQPDWWRETARQAKPLAWPQQKTRDTLLRAIIENQTTHAGGTWVVMSARQTMKNEVEGEIEALTLYGFSRKGGIYVRTAPSWDQIVTSKQRLMDVLSGCPICRAYGRARQTEGNFTAAPWSLAKIRFVTSSPEAHVVGATASLALSNDEFQDVDAEHYELAIEPFAGFHHAPIFCWGVASEGVDLLQRERDRNAEQHPERNLIFDADLWAAIWPNTYGRMWAGKLSKYGRDNPALRMNYLLQPVSAIASFLGSYMEALLASDFNRASSPPEPWPGQQRPEIVMCIDIAGEEDMSSEEVVEALRAGQEQLDSTAVIIALVDRRTLISGMPKVSILDARVWIGKPWEQQQRELEQLIELWQPKSIAADACGIGQMIVRGLRKRFGMRVLAYTADAESIHEDINELYAYLYNGLIKLYRNDSGSDYEQAVGQLRTARRIVKGGKLKVGKDKTTDRIDFAKALTYLPRAIKRSFDAPAATGGESGGQSRRLPRASELVKRAR